MQVLFKAELKLDRIAPTRTAAKKPVSHHGSTSRTSVPYARTALRLLPSLNHENIVGHDAGKHEVERPEQLQQPGQQHTLLAFGQVARRQRPLDDLLVRAPVENVDDQDAGEDVPERDRRLRSPDGVQPVRNLRRKRLEAAENAGVAADQLQPENRDEKAAGQKPDAVQHVRKRGRTQPAEQRIGRTDEPDHPDRKPEQDGVILNPGQLRQIQDARHALRAGIEDDRQQNRHVCDKKNQIADDLSRAVETDLKQLRHRRNAALQETGQEEERHGDQRHPPRRPPTP